MQQTQQLQPPSVHHLLLKFMDQNENNYTEKLEVKFGMIQLWDNGQMVSGHLFI